LVNRVAARVSDPQTGVSVLERKRAQLRLAGSGPDASDDDRELAEIAANPVRDIPLGAPGSGTDYTAFLDHLGIPSLNLEFGGEGDIGGVYHSAYDTPAFYARFADPGFRYGPVLAKVAGHMVLRLADSVVPPQRFDDLADAVSGYLEEVKRLADERRETAVAQAKLLSAHVFRLAADPDKLKAPPATLRPVPRFNFAPMETALAHLRRSANSYDAAVTAHAANLPLEDSGRLFSLVGEAEQALAPDVGLPGRPWYRNLVYAPGRLTGYSAKTLPGIREAVEEQRWEDAKRYIEITAAALDAAAERLDSARHLALSNR
jgi:N-acetylated-alpha-linked acidic dipeptidase